jgi:hypothetical protein
MAAASPRASFSGSRLVRLLSDLGAAESAFRAADPGRNAQPSFAERLGLWLDWTDAIALSAALGASAAAPSAAATVNPAARSAAPQRLAAVAEACQRVRGDLVKLATADVAYTAADPNDLAVDFSPCRRDYLAHQRAMDSAIAPLRAQVRAALSGLTAEGARLAALDAVMDEALRPRERQLLATLPVWLEKHFARLQQADAGVNPDPDADALPGAEDGEPDGPSLHHRYHRDMQRVLLAELDLRLQPVEGLLEALRHETTASP